MSDDFAAAAMLRLIAHGLAREGLAMPTADGRDGPAGLAGASGPSRPSSSGGPGGPGGRAVQGAPACPAGPSAVQPAPALGAPRDRARVPLDHKRALLQALVDAHGPERLLRIGRAAVDAPDEPTASALLAATDPPDLIARWQRLERYVHSRHRVRVLAEAPGRLHLAHVSLAAGQPPWPAEDLLVWGLLIGLLERLGTPGLAHQVDLTATAELVLHWQPPAPAPAPTPRAADRAVPAGAAAAATPTGPALLTAAEQALAADPAAPWTLPRLGRQLGLPPRTLQRRLAAQGRSFSALWMAARLNRAAQLLLREPASAAEIGYRSGFADQAHFTRCFHRHTAFTPARYRAAFGLRG